MKLLPFFAASITVLLFACASPETTVKTGSARPKLAFSNVSSDMTLVLDGLVIGPALQFDGKPGVLLVEEGVHHLEIVSKGKTIYREKAFVSGDETKMITINPGVQ